MPHHLLVFLVGSIVVTVVPGADMALVARQVVTRSRPAAQITILGNVSGLVVHATALASTQPLDGARRPRTARALPSP